MKIRSGPASRPASFIPDAYDRGVVGFAVYRIWPHRGFLHGGRSIGLYLRRAARSERTAAGGTARYN